MKIGKKLDKGYYGKMMEKLKKASARLEVDAGIEDLQLLMPPTREIRVQTGRSLASIREERMHALDPSESSFLAQN